MSVSRKHERVNQTGSLSSSNLRAKVEAPSGAPLARFPPVSSTPNPRPVMTRLTSRRCALTLLGLAAAALPPSLHAAPPQPASGTHADYVNFTGPDGLVYPDFSYAGIHGGIPTGQPVRATVDAWRGTDTADDRAHFVEKINAAVAAGGGVVSIPAGTYHLSDCIDITADNIVIRGAGQGLTHIKLTGATGSNRGVFNFVGGGIPSFTSYPVTANAPRGAMALTVQDPSQFNVGDHIRTLLLNAPADVAGNGGNTSGVYHTFFTRVAGTTSTQILLEQPLRVAHLTSQNIQLRKAQRISRCGVEGMTIEALGNYGYFHGVRFYFGYECWTRDLHILRPCSWPIRYEDSKFCVARDSTWESPWNVGGNGNGYGGLVGAHDSLMENISLVGLRHAPIFQNWATGSVVKDVTGTGSDLQWHTEFAAENLVENTTLEQGTSAEAHVFSTTNLAQTTHTPAGLRNVLYRNDLSWRGRGIYFGGHNDGWIFAHNRVRSGGSWDYSYMIKIGDFIDDLRLHNNVFAMANNGAHGAVHFMPAWTPNTTDIGSGIYYTPDPALTTSRSAGVRLTNNAFHGFPTDKRWMTQYMNASLNPQLDSNNSWSATYDPANPPARPTAPAASLYVWQHTQKFGYAPVALNGDNGGGGDPDFVDLPVISVAASHEQTGNTAANSIDGSLSTRWAADGAIQTPVITWDLGAAATISELRLAWFNGDSRTYTFSVALSANGSTWTTVLNNQVSSGATAGLETYAFTATSARYVRLTGHGNSSAFPTWTSLWEAEIRGEAGSGGGTPTPQVFAWDDFESGGFAGGSGWSGAWTRSGSTANITDSGPFEGARHARLLTTGTLTRTVDLSSAVAPVLHIAWRANSLETGESAVIEINDGSWKTLQTITPALADNAWNDASYPLSGYNLTASFQLRVRIVANATNDRLFIDAVEISQ